MQIPIDPPESCSHVAIGDEVAIERLQLRYDLRIEMKYVDATGRPGVLVRDLPDGLTNADLYRIQNEMRDEIAAMARGRS